MASTLRNLIVPAFAALALSFAPSAQAAFNIQTTIASVVTSPSAGGSTTTYTGGTPGFSFTTSGLMVSFNDYTAMNRPVSATPNEILSFSGTYTGAAENVVITENIGIMSNGSSGTFVQTSTFTLDSVNGFQFVSSAVTPLSQQIDSSIFTASRALGTSNDFSDPTNTTSSISSFISSTAVAVPEPASVAMLGLGLVGSLGFAARRRRAVA